MSKGSTLDFLRADMSCTWLAGRDATMWGRTCTVSQYRNGPALDAAAASMCRCVVDNEALSASCCTSQRLPPGATFLGQAGNQCPPTAVRTGAFV
jgi:hypothetical protein